MAYEAVFIYSISLNFAPFSMVPDQSPSPTTIRETNTKFRMGNILRLCPSNDNALYAWSTKTDTVFLTDHLPDQGGIWSNLINVTLENPLQAAPLPNLIDTQISNSMTMSSSDIEISPSQGLVSTLPKFFLSNVRSISNKVDDFDVVVQRNGIDFAGITETWLNPSIPDSCINIHDFNLVRKDRSGQRGGGVCAFVKSNIPFVPLPDLCCPDHESLWLKLRPYRLPREYSCIVVGLVYHPPQADNNELYDHLITSLDKILASYPTAGVIVMGDFNQFDSKRLCRTRHLNKL